MLNQQREIITIGTGNCGINTATELFKQYAFEHDIDAPINNHNDNCFLKFFKETKSDNKYIPNLLNIDLDEANEINIFQDTYLIFNDYDESTNNFAYTYYNAGNKVIEEIMDKLRKMTECNECIEGFMIAHGIAGGVGSGLTYLILQKLRDEYKKSKIHTFSIYPTSEEIINNEMMLYNTMLSFGQFHEYQDLCLVFDNQKLRDITQKYLKSYLISLDGFNVINEYISKIGSGYTSNMRYDGSLNINMQELQTNLVPYESMKYCISSCAPIMPQQDIIRKYDISYDKRKILVNGFCRNVYKKGIISELNEIIYERYCDYFQFKNKLIMDSSLDTISLFVFKTDSYPITTTSDYGGKWMAVCLHYKGDIIPKDVERVFGIIKTKREIEFVDWVPTGFKMTINYNTIKVRKDKYCIIDGKERELTLIGNNQYVMWFIDSRIIYKYHMLMKNNNIKYKHLYQAQGMELTEFHDAFENIKIIGTDYDDCFGHHDLNESDIEWDEEEY